MANFLLHNFNCDFDCNSAVVTSVNFAIILNPEKNRFMVHLHLWFRPCDITKRTQTSTKSTAYVPGKDLGKSNFLHKDFAVNL